MEEAYSCRFVRPSVRPSGTLSRKELLLGFNLNLVYEYMTMNGRKVST